MPVKTQRIFDCVLCGVELLVVLSLAIVFFRVGWQLVFANGHESAPLLLDQIGNNWKALALVLVVLFYRPTRKFIEEMEKGPLGTSRKASGQSEDAGEQG